MWRGPPFSTRSGQASAVEPDKARADVLPVAAQKLISPADNLFIITPSRWAPKPWLELKRPGFRGNRSWPGHGAAHHAEARPEARPEARRTHMERRTGHGRSFLFHPRRSRSRRT